MDEPYATVQDLRDEGIDSSVLTDTAALKLILQMSRRIDRVTRERFFPRFESLRMGGRGSPLLRHPDIIPIIEVRSLQLGNAAASGDQVPIDLDTIVLQAGDPSFYLERVSDFDDHRRHHHSHHHGHHDGGRFPRGRGNVLLDGIFGWISQREMVETEVAIDFAVDETTITVDDASEFRKGDALLINDSKPVIIIGIAGDVLTVDAVPFSGFTGETVITWGRVPTEITRACLILVISERFPIGSESAADLDLDSRMISEKTDNYQYKVAGSKKTSASGGSGGSGNTTGYIDADEILRGYLPPALVGMC